MQISRFRRNLSPRDGMKPAKRFGIKTRANFLVVQELAGVRFFRRVFSVVDVAMCGVPLTTAKGKIGSCILCRLLFADVHN